MRTRLWLLASGLTLLVGLAATGCGGSSSDTTSTAASSGAHNLTITMNDFSFTPSNPTVNAGKVTINSPNQGNVEHELVIFKTDKPANSLPQRGNEVDEDGLEAHGSTDEGEIQDVGPGQTKNHTFNLAPGTYAMICNVPGHYKAGMYGTLTVK
jgi:uncharacterized cupredoxin-like copper-binding protein